MAQDRPLAFIGLDGDSETGRDGQKQLVLGPRRAMADTSISGRRAVRELVSLVAERGARGMIVSDSGTKPTLNAALAWSGEAGGKRCQDRQATALGQNTSRPLIATG